MKKVLLTLIMIGFCFGIIGCISLDPPRNVIPPEHKIQGTGNGVPQMATTPRQAPVPVLKTNKTQINSPSTNAPPRMQMPTMKRIIKVSKPKRWPNGTRPYEIKGDIKNHKVLFRDGKPSIAVAIKVRGDQKVIQFTFYDQGEKIQAPLPEAFLDYHYALQQYRDNPNTPVEEYGWTRIAWDQESGQWYDPYSGAIIQ